MKKVVGVLAAVSFAMIAACQGQTSQQAGAPARSDLQAVTGTAGGPVTGTAVGAVTDCEVPDEFAAIDEKVSTEDGDCVPSVCAGATNVALTSTTEAEMYAAYMAMECQPKNPVGDYAKHCANRPTLTECLQCCNNSRPDDNSIGVKPANVRACVEGGCLKKWTLPTTDGGSELRDGGTDGGVGTGDGGTLTYADCDSLANTASCNAKTPRNSCLNCCSEQEHARLACATAVHWDEASACNHRGLGDEDRRQCSKEANKRKDDNYKKIKADKKTCDTGCPAPGH